MCMTQKDGSIYLECTGRYVTAADLFSLTDPEMAELRNDKTSNYDTLFIHDSIHKFRSALQSAIGNFDIKLQEHVDDEKIALNNIADTVIRIEKSFYVKDCNGKSGRHMAEIVVEHHKLLHGLKLRRSALQWLKQNKVFIVISGAVTIVFTYIFKSTIETLWNKLFN